ncbi:MAG: N-acetylmuramoyl-L-alanine amidase [Nitrospinae bacterium]|nr:N-acetylmuramoyl-L-alanine amidase [Nitrospinota bacterium]
MTGAGRSIVACGRRVDIGAPVVLWDREAGYVCPNKRGRAVCAQHDPALNDQPTRPDAEYRVLDPASAYAELKKCVYQLVLHYDACYSALHCHETLKDSPFKGSHFYLDLDGVVYQTCDLYWKTNAAPADDRLGNERAVHVEISNLGPEALASDSEYYRFERDQYGEKDGRWQLLLPQKYREKILTPNFRPFAARTRGERGYFSRRINGKTVRMWDFTEEQYRSLVRLCVGVHELLPGIALRVPCDPRTGRVPLGKIENFATFAGIVGHAHVQNGTADGVAQKYDPGSAFHWARLRQELLKEERKRRGRNANKDAEGPEFFPFPPAFP